MTRRKAKIPTLIAFIAYSFIGLLVVDYMNFNFWIGFVLGGVAVLLGAALFLIYIVE